MSSDECAVRVHHVSKCYQIYGRPQHRLKQSIVPRLERLVGRTPTRYFREFWALSDVSFDVRKGETVGIIGRNGSGKSTLLQVICGTVAPTMGSVEVSGRVAALLELGAGFNPEFTGRENVYMNGTLLGLSEVQIDERFDDIASFADIGEFIEQPVKTYSSGMYVRLAFAVMAHVDADLLVIDEALAVGDVFFVQRCMRFLRGFMERGTVLFVSHDAGAVSSLCQRAVWLERGHVQMIGTPKTVTAQYHAAMYEAQQGAGAQGDGSAAATQLASQAPRDARQDFINASNLRNDLQVFSFDPGGPAFGKGGARIVGVELTATDGAPLAWVVGGEDVSLVIRAAVDSALSRPIVGFFVKDRLGQALFGDNTFLSYLDAPIPARPGDVLEARFAFRMPVLPVGEYSICVAVADGTQHDHVQHHWLHDAVILRSHSSSLATGLVGVPMREIELRVATSTADGRSVT